MRLGGSVVSEFKGPGQFVDIALDSGFKAVVFPLNHKTPEDEIDSLKREIDEAGIIIAEVGAWRNNPLDASGQVCKEALENIKKQLDIVNMINSPLLLYRNAEFTRECFEKLGPYIKSIHVKDINIEQKLTVHLNECLVGEGCYDFKEFFNCASKLEDRMPVLVEHIKIQEDYKKSVSYLRNFAVRMGIEI